MSDRIPVYRPSVTSRERELVLDCVDSTWISSNGEYINKFENSISSFTGIRNSISVFNGTVALHLAMQCLGIKAGDEVLVPTFTYIASVNSIISTGATPVLVESRRDDWLIDVRDAEARITPKTKAIMAVHLYGFACDMEAIRRLADKYDLLVIEDAAEALGVFVEQRHVGWASDAATFSFFGNKTITCGEGGIVVTNNDRLSDALRVTKNHGMDPNRRYWHDRLGFNYRMTNIQAAIGCAQMERIKWIVDRKRAVYEQYRDELSDLPLEWQSTSLKDLNSSYWLVSALAPSETIRDRLMSGLADEGIETRPVFYSAHQMPMLSPTITERFPIAEDISSRGMSLPSYPDLTPNDVSRICDAIKKYI